MLGVLVTLIVSLGFSRTGARRSPVRLAADSRGAILVLGILLGAMLVSVLFHIASVGQAILWRENAQDAADAVAYEAALWNARGMNVIVALNIFLALLIAILMFWRLVMIVVITMLALSALACLAVALVPGMQFLQPLCNMTPRLANITRQMVQRDMQYTPRLYRAMTIIHKGQVIVASATPVISAVRSSLRVMGDENYDVELALGVGIQLLPSALYPKSPEPGDQPDGDTPCGVEPAPRGAAQSGGILGMPVSLPMEHVAEMDELCGKGGTMQTRIAGAILSQIGGVFGLGELGTALSGGPFAEIWSFITEILSPVLCESLNGSVAERLQEIIDRACASASDRAKCEQDMRDEADRNNGQVDLNNTQADVKGVSSEDVMYSKPYWLAQNGNLFMQSWGVVLAKRRFVQEADRLIRFSNRFGGEGKFTELEEEAWVVAGAEMFVDCTDGWEKCQYQAPWTMNWRARLRRFHDPGEYAGAVAEKILAEGLWSGLERLLEKGPLGNLINRVTGSNALGGSVVGRFGGSHIHGFVLSMAREELTERFRSTVYDKGGIRSAAQRAADGLGAGRHEIIH